MNNYVRPSRRPWRDLRLNERHRDWGRDCPAVNLDFVEFDNFYPIALMEAKCVDPVAGIREGLTTSESLVIDRLAAGGTATLRAGEPRFERKKPLPFFVYEFNLTLTHFLTCAINTQAMRDLKQFCGTSREARRARSKVVTDCKRCAVHMTERAFVAFLYFLRDRPFPEEMFDGERLIITEHYDSYMSSNFVKLLKELGLFHQGKGRA
jgi:hypothetical protein